MYIMLFIAWWGGTLGLATLIGQSMAYGMGTDVAANQ